jgi:predicted transcriptional regulator
MGHQMKVKDLRNQLRNVVKEILPELLSAELKSEMHQKFQVEVQKRLDNVTKNVKDTLDTIDQRSKDIQGYLVRATTQPLAPAEESSTKTPE